MIFGTCPYCNQPLSVCNCGVVPQSPLSINLTKLLAKLFGKKDGNPPSKTCGKFPVR